MNEEPTRVIKAYKRAAIGLAAAAICWTAVYLLVERQEGEQRGVPTWLIPIGAAALGTSATQSPGGS